MSRLTHELGELLAASHRGGWLVELEFDGPAYVRCTTWPYPLTWNAATWPAWGRVVSVGAPGDGLDLRARTLPLVLSGVPSTADAALDLQAQALLGDWQGRPARLWWAVVAEDGAVAGAALLRAGTMDRVQIDDDGETVTVTCQIESRHLEALRRPDLYYSDASQQALHPGDRFFRHVPALGNAALPWPGPPA